MSKRVYIIGAGPAGLTAALLLQKEGHDVTVFESSLDSVGGLAKTVLYKGFRFDVGGHRFFTKSQKVHKFWNDILKDDFLTRERKSRIYYQGKFLNYPLQLGEVLRKFSPMTTSRFLLSYIKSFLFSKKVICSYEDWVIQHFGEKLYQAFFKSYTEKVWGRKCHEISSDWAAQRINGLNIGSLAYNSISKIFGIKNRGPKTLIEEFQYPRLGPGMLWEKTKDIFLKHDGKLLMGKKVTEMRKGEKGWLLRVEGEQINEPADHIISTAPIAQIFESLGLEMGISREIQQFQYRGFLTVALMFKSKESLPDNWLYIHDENVKVARIQNYKRWSPEMVPSDDFTCYGLEYFCQEGDELWKKSDIELFELAKLELDYLGITYSQEQLDFKVIKAPKAYPVYDHDYEDRLSLLKEKLKAYKGLHLIGRNGMHRYNNQDHSIMTAMIVVDGILNEKEGTANPWAVNQDAEYIEGGYSDYS